MEKGKTSTFTIHHDRCNPAAWTAHEVLCFAEFVKHGSLQKAAQLSKLGVQLVLSEHHTPKGGELERVGWAPANSLDEVTDNLDDLDIDETMEVVPVYRGKSEFAVRYTVGDGDGNVEGHEYEIKPTEAEANAFLASLTEAAE